MLYISTFSAHLSRTYSQLERACACISLADYLLTKSDRNWSSYLQRLTGLESKDISPIKIELAKKYVRMLNMIKPWREELSGESVDHKYFFVFVKFDFERYHRVARFIPRD